MSEVYQNASSSQNDASQDQNRQYVANADSLPDTAPIMHLTASSNFTNTNKQTYYLENQQTLSLEGGTQQSDLMINTQHQKEVIEQDFKDPKGETTVDRDKQLLQPTEIKNLTVTSRSDIKLDEMLLRQQHQAQHDEILGV